MCATNIMPLPGPEFETYNLQLTTYNLQPETVHFSLFAKT